MNDRRFTAADLAEAFALVGSGARGKVVVEL